MNTSPNSEGPDVCNATMEPWCAVVADIRNRKITLSEKYRLFHRGGTRKMITDAVAYLLVALNDQVTPDQMSVRYFTTIDCRQPKCL
jgi:hypothetical protein